MLVIVFFGNDDRPVLVSLGEKSAALASGDPGRALFAITAALAASGYEAAPSSYASLDASADMAIGEVETLALRDLVPAAGENAEVSRALDVVMGDDAWMILAPALAELVVAAEDALDEGGGT